MKKILLLTILLIPLLKVNGQDIGDFAPDPKPIIFPDNAFGADIMFGEGGFGLGGFYRKSLSDKFTLFTDLSISEAKDEKEVEYVDYYGRVYVFGKKNRIFLIPLNLGLQYRLFSESITDNLRPYINFGAGPSMAVTTPYEMEFFSSFKKARAYYTIGGYFGFGANFGLDTKSLMGINIRYYVIHFFGEGIEGLEKRYNKNFGGFYLTINIGTMF
ncbi:MAG: hypothetical protein Q8N03_09195 [Ignavibacteria bacterium]|jgi:hypothetical protein|nr:hypothetical protein [Ignavibacteria bacterium]